VVLGVGAQLSRAASGFTRVQRRQLGELLEDLLDVLVQVGGTVDSTSQKEVGWVHAWCWIAVGV
jgi:hypothetical protein